MLSEIAPWGWVAFGIEVCFGINNKVIMSEDNPKMFSLIRGRKKKKTKPKTSNKQTKNLSSQLSVTPM